jgi:hypothetical protein
VVLLLLRVFIVVVQVEAVKICVTVVEVQERGKTRKVTRMEALYKK